MTAFDVRRNRREWKETIRPEMAEYLAFLDESDMLPMKQTSELFSVK